MDYQTMIQIGHEINEYPIDLENCSIEELQRVLYTYSHYYCSMKPVEEMSASELTDVFDTCLSMEAFKSECCLEIATFQERIDRESAIIKKDDGDCYLVYVSADLDENLLVPNASVGIDVKSLAIMKILPALTESTIQVLDKNETLNITFDDIGGLDKQKKEIKEIVELSLNHAELFEEVGVDLPKGILMHGAPGCGKTLIAQAIANETNAAFFRFSGSDFVKQYLGDGPKMMRDAFDMAKQHAPSIIFIDEIDAIAAKRQNSDGKSDNEIHRILNELLIQMDGFEEIGNVKVILATNRIEVLDSALLRPGRIDKIIRFQLPNQQEAHDIISKVSRKMNLSSGVDIECLSKKLNNVSAAEINLICQEAGLSSIRDHRCQVTMDDFERALDKTMKKTSKQEKEMFDFYM